MTQEKALTGYPSIDKPWLKYYSEEAINAPLPECTIYEYLWEQNKEFLEDTAIVYLGRKISYRELFVNIDRVAESFWSLGVREGDIKSRSDQLLTRYLYYFEMGDMGRPFCRAQSRCPRRILGRGDCEKTSRI